MSREINLAAAMGASQSKSQTDEKIFHDETPIQFSQDLVNFLSDGLASPDMTPERQTTLDGRIRSRIQEELRHLREEEDAVRREIGVALEKENLDKERNLNENSVSDEVSDSVKSGIALLYDLEEIQHRVDKFRQRQGLGSFPVAKAMGGDVVQCYKAHPTKSLDCWREVARFKAAVAQAEQTYFKSLG